MKISEKDLKQYKQKIIEYLKNNLKQTYFSREEIRKNVFNDSISIHIIDQLFQSLKLDGILGTRVNQQPPAKGIGEGNPKQYRIINRNKLTENKVWKDKLQKVYSSFEEWKDFSEMYGLAKRLGFKDEKEAWDKNPMIQGSVNPKDYKVVKDYIDNKIKKILENYWKDDLTKSLSHRT
jgi:hypothetical protein